MKLFMLQLSTTSVSLCSLNVVGKIKMGGHKARMARMGTTEVKRPLRTATCILSNAVDGSGLDSGGSRWGAGSGECRDEASCFTNGGEVVYVSNFQLL
jgi:hypothetical protein